MQLYKTTATYVGDEGASIAAVVWSGTQADARADRKKFKELGSKNAKTTDVNVPTSKAELISWLNDNKVGAI